MPSLDMIGVNNRSLKTFEVSLDTSKVLASYIPDEFVKVSEKRNWFDKRHCRITAIRLPGIFNWRAFYENRKPGKSSKRIYHHSNFLSHESKNMRNET